MKCSNGKSGGLVVLIASLTLFPISGPFATADDAKAGPAAVENARTGWSQCVKDELDGLSGTDMDANNAVVAAMSDCSNSASAFQHTLTEKPLSMDRDQATLVTSLVEKLIREYAVEYLAGLRVGY